MSKQSFLGIHFWWAAKYPTLLLADIGYCKKQQQQQKKKHPVDILIRLREYILDYPKRAQGRFGSDYANAQADLNLH